MAATFVINGSRSVLGVTQFAFAAGLLGRDGKVTLYCPGVALVRLPWWPEDVERGNGGRTWEEVPRPGREPLLLSSGRNLDTYSLGFTLRKADGSNVAEDVDAIEAIANSEVPCSLIMAGTLRGTFQVAEPPVFVELEHGPGGRPVVVDVSMTLKRASDATVKVGPVPRKKKRNQK